MEQWIFDVEGQKNISYAAFHETNVSIVSLTTCVPPQQAIRMFVSARIACFDCLGLSRLSCQPEVFASIVVVIMFALMKDTMELYYGKARCKATDKYALSFLPRLRAELTVIISDGLKSI